MVTSHSSHQATPNNMEGIVPFHIPEPRVQQQATGIANIPLTGQTELAVAQQATPNSEAVQYIPKHGRETRSNVRHKRVI